MFKLAAIFLLTTVVAASAATPPILALHDMHKLPVVVTAPYDEKADADAQVAAAFVRAKQNGKLVLIDFGGNWCPDCVILANILRLPEMQPFMAAHYEVVSVDIGRFDKNLQIPARLGIDKKQIVGVPAVLVVTPDGKVINSDKFTMLDNARAMTPQAIADWLGRWPD
jgi:thiol-disulfide isomerase/thioredoxin